MSCLASSTRTRSSPGRACWATSGCACRHCSTDLGCGCPVAWTRLWCGVAFGRVPDPHRAVLAAAGEAPAVGAERHASDLGRVACEGEHFLALGRVPDSHRAVLAAADEALAVGAERHAGDRVRVALEGEDLPAG